jgi:hypothetical protein
VEAVESILEDLDANPYHVISLTDWPWIAVTLNHLATEHAACATQTGISA